jgi:hypothetical protein
MKKILLTVLGVVAVSVMAMAQQDDKSVKESIKDGAKAVGHETAEKASTLKAKVVDKTYEGKEGPKGQTIYIDENSKYYWIDEKGHKVYISEARLQDKQKK